MPLSPDDQKELVEAFAAGTGQNSAGSEVLELERQQWQRIVAPCLVAREHTDPLPFQLRLPESALHKPLCWLVCEENGNRREGECSIPLPAVSARHEIQGEKYAAAELRLSIQLPCGYHTISFRAEGGSGREINGTCSLIITPASCYVPPGLQEGSRIWGVACRLETLRSRRNWGIGDFSDLGTLLSWSSQHGAGTLAVQPLQAWFPAPVENPGRGRYASLCFLDPLYLDPEDIADFHESEEARNVFQDPALKMRLAQLRDQECLDPAEVSRTKNTIFDILWRHFQENHLEPDTDRGREFRRFQQNGGEDLKAYALFEALREHFEEKGLGNWSSWPGQYQTRHSEAVADFTAAHGSRIQYHQYLQWQAELQLAAIGRRSMELGLKVGLLQTLADAVSLGSFETWYRPGLYALNMKNGCDSGRKPEMAPSDSPPLCIPKMAESAYEAFIAALRANMRHSGALCVPYSVLAEQQCWLPREKSDGKAIYLENKVHELLGIIALESLRNRCLVACEHGEELSAEWRNVLHSMSIFLYNPGHFEKDVQGDWISPENYPPRSITAASSSSATSLNGFWQGKDIEIGSRMHPTGDASWREDRIISRSADRAHMLIALHHEDLLPEGYDVDPSKVPWLSADLVNAVHHFLVKTSSRIFLLPLQDLPHFQKPAFGDETALSSPVWLRKVPADLEEIQEEETLHALFRTFCAERGIGVVRPSALRTDRKESRTAGIPRAFYRLQLSSAFTFLQASEVVPYLSELGISHCYTSPCLMARPGSPHGYDIIDHSVLNPEIGSREEFERFVAALDRCGMAQIMDMVPNHMGVGSDNRWWMDVLENGQASLYADFFDINWDPQQQELKGKVLLPVLGDHYGSILEGGQLRLDFNGEKGVFSILYYEHCFPVDPRTYPFILGHDIKRLEGVLGSRHNGFLELQNLLSSFQHLADRRETLPERIETRQRNKEVLKRLLARLCREVPEIATFIQENVILFNGEKGLSESYDLLDTLLTMQTYQLAFWRVAADEINYRRFFDINDLAGIRVENKRVFRETHRLVLDLIATGRVDGLRIDHPDGLYDPKGYFCRLQEAVSDENALSERLFEQAEVVPARNFPLYVVVEKILADFEHLPPDWPVHGTTGYDFSVLVNGLFIDRKSERDITRIYHRFIGHAVDFTGLLYSCKKLIIKTSMAGELNVLAGELNRLAKMNRYTRDFTLNGLRQALTEFVAHFPVYRTYIISAQIAKRDRNYIEWALAKARAGQRAEETSIYDFLMSVLLLDVGSDMQGAATDFVMKLQQYTGPVMAKGLEDTSFYIFNRLLSLNEVGGDPCRFGTSTAAFHQANRERAHYFPHGMLNTSTHDSKRSEDVRARINVLSEMPEEWEQALRRWSACNKDKKTRLAGRLAPSKNDEYALYQNLLGIWPFHDMDEEAAGWLTGRMEEYMLKVVREAKVHTSWINQNPDYEEAMTHFVRGILAEKSPFLMEFIRFQKKIAWFGLFNSLSQLLLKLTSPGIPDIYQGSELWYFFLVDPDNRRPVDFHQRMEALERLRESFPATNGGLADRVGRLLENMTDGRVKLYVLWRALHCRRMSGDLFERGAYISLAVQGEKEEHVCAFMRQYGEQRLIVAVPRLTGRLLGKDAAALPLGRGVWSDTAIILPDNQPELTFSNMFTGEEIRTGGADKKYLDAAGLFSSFPVCLLLHTSEKGERHD